MTLSSELFNAILSMDAYNRGYDASIHLPVVINSTQLGNATITAAIADDNAAAKAIGFYALSYSYNGETIIAYRGTDYPSEGQKTNGIPNDIYHGWTLGSGDIESEQAQMAVEFYQAIAESFELPGSDNIYLDASISLTGHSLGGGLAGYVASLYNQEADCFDSMTFVKATQETYDQAVEYRNYIAEDKVYKITVVTITDPLLLPSTKYVTAEELQSYQDNTYFLVSDVEDLRESFAISVYGDGSSSPWMYSSSEVHEYYTVGEVLHEVLLGRDTSTLEGSTYYYLGIDGEEYNLKDTSAISQVIYSSIGTFLAGDAGSAFTNNITLDEIKESVALHSQASLIIRMFADETGEVDGNFWETSAEYFWPIMYDTGFASKIGFEDKNSDSVISGELQEQGKYADILRMAIAYSAIDEGNDAGKPFGDTAIRAFYDDANDLGEVLQLENASSTVVYYAYEISKVYVHFSGLLALNDIESADHISTDDPLSCATNGVLSYETGDTSLVVDMSDALWEGQDMTIKGITPQSYIVSKIISDAGAEAALREYFENITGNNSVNAVDRIVFAVNDTGGNITIDEPTQETDKITLVVGSDGVDLIEGSSANEMFFDGTGADQIDGNAGNDFFLVGSNPSGLEGDSYDGGTGVDTLNLSSLSFGVKVNLEYGTMQQWDLDVDQFSYYSEFIDSLRGYSSPQFTKGYIINLKGETEGTIDTVSNIENVVGTSYNDVIYTDVLTSEAGTLAHFDGGAGDYDYINFTSAVSVYDMSAGRVYNELGTSVADISNFEYVDADVVLLPTDESFYTQALIDINCSSSDNGGIFTIGRSTVDWSEWSSTTVIFSDRVIITAAGNVGGLPSEVYGTQYDDVMVLNYCSSDVFGGNGGMDIYGGDGDDIIILREVGTASDGSTGLNYIYRGGSDVISNAHMLSSVTLWEGITEDMIQSVSWISQSHYDGGGVTGDIRITIDDENSLTLQNVIINGGYLDYSVSLYEITLESGGSYIIEDNVSLYLSGTNEVQTYLEGTWGDDEYTLHDDATQSYYAKSGDDIIRVGDNGTYDIYGGDGNDKYYVRSGSETTLWEVNGCDYVYATNVSSTDFTYEISGDDLVFYDGSGDLFAELKDAENFVSISFSDGETYFISDILNGLLEGYQISADDDVVDASGSSASLIIDLQEGNDDYTGTDYGDEIVCGTGDDTYNTGSGDDAFVYEAGVDGNDTISDTDGTDTLHVTGGLVYTDISFYHDGDDLIIKLPYSTDTITIKDQLSGDEASVIENIYFDDDTVFALPTLLGDLSLLDLDDYTVSDYGYSGQNPDANATVTVEDDGATIHLSGNTWDQIDLDYTVTSDTVIEFDFKSTVEGEIQGFGFDTNSSLSSNLTFKLSGTQSWGISDTATYSDDGEWVHYTINVGAYYTGDFTTLFFVNDDDANSAAESYFSNITVYERDNSLALDLSDYRVSDYGYSGQNPDANATVTVEDDGATIHLSGNTWDQIDYAYTVTSNTVIEFDFKSTVEGEIQGFGFDTNSSLSYAQTFQLYGTQAWGIKDTNTYSADGEWVHYTINVGAYYTGDYTTMFFVNDDDANAAAESYFSNITVYERDNSLALDLEDYRVSDYGYSGQNPDVNATNTIEDDGATIHLSGNTWDQIDYAYTVTENTVIEFDFKSTVEGEIQGLGFDTNSYLSADYTLKLSGTQAWGITETDTYESSDGEWVHYTINVGSYYTGDFTSLFFVNDDDAHSAADSYFSNITVYEQENSDITGTDDSDIIFGSDADDVIYGYGGEDVLYGQDGADAFVFESISAFSGIDTIKDFDISEGDMLDISDLMSGYDPLADAISDFVQITEDGSNSCLYVDTDGETANENFQQIAVLEGVTDLGSIEEMIAGGQLLAA